MQMNTDGIIGISGEISLVTQECASFNIDFICVCRKLGVNIGISGRVSHVSIVSPDLPSGMKGVIRDADDQR